MLPERVLADTHTFIWYVEDNPLMSPVAKAIISNPDCQVAISIELAWEMTIKADSAFASYIEHGLELIR